MKSASVPRPLAEIILHAMHGEDGPHHEGWTQRITPAWYIVRQSAHYRLLHGRKSLGNIDLIEYQDHPDDERARFLDITMASGLVLSFPIREPRGAQ